jgi:O-antigen/teichoic acid export membrane protein
VRELLKATLKTGSGSGFNLLLGIIATKILAVVLGPSGIGLYSLLRQAIEVTKGVGTLGGEAALVQGLASRKGKPQDEYLVTTFWLFMLGASLVVVVLVGFAPWISPWILDRSDAQSVSLIRALAIPSALWVLSIYLTSVLNGFRAIGMLALLQVLGATAMALLAYPVAQLADAGYSSAFIVMVSAPPTVGAMIGGWYALRSGWLAPLFHSHRIIFHRESTRHFFSIAGTMLVAVLIATGTIMGVRSLIVHYDGLSGAGIFAVAWTLSSTYVMLVLSSFQTYYLPTLSDTSDATERIALMQRVVRLVTLMMLPLVISLIVLKPLVIELLYSEEFLPALDLIRWMLIGDYFKVISWVFSMSTIAYADMKVFFWTEFLWHAGFLALGSAALFGFGSIQGFAVAFLLMYILYLAYYLHYARSRHQFSLTGSLLMWWLIGLTLVIGASWQTWSDVHVDWGAAILWLLAATAFAGLSLKQSERREILRFASRLQSRRRL